MLPEFRRAIAAAAVVLVILSFKSQVGAGLRGFTPESARAPRE